MGAASDAALHWSHPTLAQRVLLLALVPVTALLGAVWNVAFWTMFAGCQAFVYRAIAGREAPAA